MPSSRQIWFTALLVVTPLAVTGADDVRTYLDGAIEATEAYHQRIVTDARKGKAPSELEAERTCGT